MLVTKKITEFLIFESETILHGLEKLNRNQKRVLFVVSENGQLLGSFSDGDFRKWVTDTRKLDLESPITEVMCSSSVYKNIEDSRNEIEKEFSIIKKSIDVIPLVDDYKRVVAIAFAKEKGFSIGNSTISEDSPSYIIAEIGNNHQGDINLAKKLVELAVNTGADCVKFQMRDMNSLYKSGNKQDESADLGAQYTMDLLSKYQLSNEELIEVFDYCKSFGLTPLCTPWDIKSLEVLEDYGMEAYKVASADFTNHELLMALINTGKPLICSTGMSTESEIIKTVELLKSHGAQYVLLHCNSTYPTPFKDVNLAYLPRLKQFGDSLVGYSGHERGISVPIAAAALGAKVIEKHFTIDKTLIGNDHKVSLLPEEFTEMVRSIREVEESLGSDGERALTQGEMINRETLAKSLVAKDAIPVGCLITRDMVEVKSPGQGLQPVYLDSLIGKTAKRSLGKGDFFFESDLDEILVKAKPYKYDRPFGIPVRYHDYKKLVEQTNFDFVEFHLSYQDMELSIQDYFKAEQDIGFAVHSPELFANDHILDLASDNESYREHSISLLNQVCEVTRQLKSYFPKTEKPVIVLNAGGFSGESFLKDSDKPELYARIAESLDKIDQTGVEITIQTMPPFPWHFGGQRFHNLFVDPKEIADFCSKYGYRICYDISHSMMACNYFKWDLMEFTQVVGKYVAHLHVVDAKGVDGEGIEVGKGDVDFSALGVELNKGTPNVQFIPEVWQGHKNNGEGFWKALAYLENYL